MKTQVAVIVALMVVLSYFGAHGAIGSYDYCGKPCNDGGSMVCAYNQICHTVFMNRCEMKKRNCDYNDRFMVVAFSGCFFGVKCRGI